MFSGIDYRSSFSLFYIRFNKKEKGGDKRNEPAGIISYFSLLENIGLKPEDPLVFSTRNLVSIQSLWALRRPLKT